MNCLLDAHILIWGADAPENLSAVVGGVLQNPNNTLYVSSGTIWEICIKVGLGKLELNQSLEPWLNAVLTQLEINILPISVSHAIKQADLPFHHRDPFDRLIASQALVEGYFLLSADSIFDQHGVHRIW